MTQRRLRNWEIVESREVFTAEPWIRVHRQSVRLPDGRVIPDYHQLEIPDCCIMYAQTQDGSVLVERQYKHGPRSVGLSLPAGALDAGEDPLAAAKRELREETGYEATEWRSLGAFSLNGNYGAGRAHLFSAKGARRVTEPASGDLEDMEILELAPAELRAALDRGEIHLLGAAMLVLLAMDTKESKSAA